MQPTCTRLANARYALGGALGERLAAVTRQWLLVAPDANPAMLEMFRDRDRRPYRDLVPWAGEFAGKYLTSAVQVLRLTGDPALRRRLGAFVRELVSLQAEDGYLGPWPRRYRLAGVAPNVGGKPGNTWDAWGHYHVMLGLLLWSDESGDAAALAAVQRSADLLCARFLGRRRRRLVDTGSTEMNLAPVHALALLYQRCPEQRYLDLALQIVAEFAATGPGGPLAGDYLRHPLAGGEFFAGPKPRWESLHPIMGLAELYWVTGAAEFRRAFEQTWWSIVRWDRHNNGGFSSGEQAQGNPYHRGAIETCCTVAWMAASVEMLRLTGDSVVADELELSTLNSVLGLVSPSGRWVTYDTPMDGVRRASAHEIVFQARPGSPELNCCSVNGPRGLGLVSDWAVMDSGRSLRLNYYGPGTVRVRYAGTTVELRQQTEYPCEGRIVLAVTPTQPRPFRLELRIPHWSARTRATVNGESVRGVCAGTYLALERHWRRGDRVRLDLDMSLHFWRGERECRGLTSVYRGPILLAYDRRLDAAAAARVPVLDARSLVARRRVHASGLPVMLALDVRDARGARLRLCDFASAGQAGTPYRSWLRVRHAPRAAFRPTNPLRSARR